MKKFILLCLILSSCTTTQTLIHTNTVVITPPDSLFSCPPLPNLPAGPKVSDVDNANFTENLAQTAIGCKEELNTVHQAIQNEKQIVINNPVKDVQQ